MSYYADFVTIPIVGILALVADVSYHGLTFALILAAVVGFLAWSFVEYAMHRWLFHRTFRRDHWLHHFRPAAYVGVPSWQTTLGAAFLAVQLIGALDFDLGTGAFLGLAAGYLLYIFAHDRFHHGRLGLRPGYWHERRIAHLLHHAKGQEVNFGVASPAWDMLLGTYQPPL